MSLLNTKPTFETETETSAVAETVKVTNQKLSTTKPSSEVVVEPAKSAVIAPKVNLRVMESFKDAMVVDYNTLNQIIATNGNFVDRETKTVLGDKIAFELLSYQDSYVVSPNDDDAPEDMVRYSNDGKVCSDGTDVEEHLKFLKDAGFPKSSLKQRVVVVAAVQSATKTDKFNGQLVQFDLSPASRVQWNRHTANVAYALSIGKLKPEQLSFVTAETTLQQKGTNTFTQVQFNVTQ